MSLHRILSLDGGGSWALIQVKALIALYSEETTGHRVLDDFEGAIGNSGGSIVLAGLAEDLPLGKLLALFQDESQRRSMFVGRGLLGDLAKRARFGPRYAAAEKLAGLRHVLPRVGDTRMRGWRPEKGRDVAITICGFDYDRQRAVFFRTREGTPTAGRSARRTTVSQRAVEEATFAEAVHASSNAPVNYFDAPAEFRDGRFWDGAMGGYNNPALAGVVEAIGAGVSPSSIRVLSLGTGGVVLPEEGTASDDALLMKRRDGGILRDALSAATCILDDPPDAASFMAHVVLGGRVPDAEGELVANGPVVRMNPLVAPVSGTKNDWTLPQGMTLEEFAALAATDMDAITVEEVSRIARFADLWIGDQVQNQPIRASRWLEVEVGHDRFGAALAAWRSWNR
jgi:hypothetical protein